MNIITLSLGRQILRKESGDRSRMRMYAQHLDAFHCIVLSRRKHGFTDIVHEDHLHLYPTNSITRLGMLIDAFYIARKILKEDQKKQFSISAQDPFELGFMCFLIAKIYNARFHLQLHGDYFDSLWEGVSLIRRIRLRVAHFLFTEACGIRVASERIKKSLIRRGLPESKITVLPIRPMLEAFLSCRRPVRIDDALIFVTTSRLSPEKNIPLMLYAFHRCVQKYPHIKLRIIGGGEEKDKINVLISKLSLHNTVTMKPWTDDVPREMATADVFLLASDHEAYGLVLIEALASGLPVVTTDVGCVGEVFKHNVHGLVVPPRDVDAYVGAMEIIISEPTLRAEMSKAGKSLAYELQNVSSESYAKAWVAAHTCSGKEV